MRGSACRDWICDPILPRRGRLSVGPWGHTPCAHTKPTRQTIHPHSIQIHHQPPLSLFPLSIPYSLPVSVHTHIHTNSLHSSLFYKSYRCRWTGSPHPCRSGRPYTGASGGPCAVGILCIVSGLWLPLDNCGGPCAVGIWDFGA